MTTMRSKLPETIVVVYTDTSNPTPDGDRPTLDDLMRAIRDQRNYDQDRQSVYHSEVVMVGPTGRTFVTIDRLLRNHAKYVDTLWGVGLQRDPADVLRKLFRSEKDVQHLIIVGNLDADTRQRIDDAVGQFQVEHVHQI